MKNLFLISTLLILTRIGSAQFYENFDDGDFSDWAGDDTAFFVNDLFQLQLDGNCEDGGTNYISVPVATNDTATWEFFLDLNFDPSASNHARFYLQSDNSVLTGPLNGYYIRIGEDGSNDAVKLYRQSGLTSTLLLTGTLAEVAISPTVRVKVVRNTDHEWTIFVDATGGFTYVNEGSVIDDVFIGGNYIGWYCKYTSTRCDDFFLDDVSAGPLYEDVDAPQITSVTVENTTQIEIDFNENLELISAEDESNYFIDNGVGNPIDATRGPTDFSKVLLTFIDDFPEGILLTLTVSDIADENGNVLISESESFTIYTVGQYDVVINEIFADIDPQIYLPMAEYIELYNNTALDINLEDFKLFDATSESDPFPIYNLAANDYVIVCDINVMDSFAAFTNILFVSDFPSLNNDADDLQLFDANGNLIHRVAYDADWYDHPVKDDGGWSLEMIDPTNPCQGAENWVASEDASGGTPGYQNSVFGSNPDENPPVVLSAYPLSPDTIIVYFNEALELNSVHTSDFNISNGIGNPVSLVLDANQPFFVGLVLATPFTTGITYTLTVTDLTDCSGNNIGMLNTVLLGIPEPVAAGDLVINEVLFNPYSGGFDFVEIYNVSNKILDLSKIMIAELDLIDTTQISEYEYISDEGKLFFPQTYLCVTPDVANILSTYHAIDTGNFIESTGLPGFNDSEGIVAVYDYTLQLIDQLHYYDDWHYALLADLNGVSLERISFDHKTQDPNNWHSAAADVRYATPGYQNSVFGDIAGGGDIVLEYPVFSPDGDGYRDLLLISYETAAEGYTGIFKIFDTQGRLIHDLNGLTTLSREGFITWDGVDADGIAARMGIYILYVELFNAEGNMEKHKLKFTLVRR